jgi:hypothetical protein
VGGPDDPREEGALLEGQVADALGEVEIRRVLNPVYPAGTFLSEVDLVQIRLEDLLLGEANLEEHRELGLPDLPPEAFLRREEEIFRELLGDGGPSLYDPHLAQVCSQGPHDPDEVDPEVRVEAGVFRREHRVPEVIRNGVERNHPPRLHLRSEDPGDLLRFEDEFLERASGQSFQGDDASLGDSDLGPDAGAGRFSRPEPPGVDPETVAVLGPGPRSFRVSLHLPVGEAAEPLRKPQVVHEVPRPDGRRSSVQDRRDFPGVACEPCSHLDVEVSQMEEKEHRESAEEGAGAKEGPHVRRAVLPLSSSCRLLG